MLTKQTNQHTQKKQKNIKNEKGTVLSHLTALHQLLVSSSVLVGGGSILSSCDGLCGCSRSLLSSILRNIQTSACKIWLHSSSLSVSSVNNKHFSVSHLCFWVWVLKDSSVEFVVSETALIFFYIPLHFPYICRISLYKGDKYKVSVYCDNLSSNTTVYCNVFD